VVKLFRPQKRKKEVVVVGASFGGLAVRGGLAGRSDVNLTIVDFKDYFEYTPGILRCFIEPSYLGKLTCPLASDDCKFVCGSVTGVSATAVTVQKADGSTIELNFDYCVLACGSTYQQPVKPVASEATLAERQASWERAAAKLTASDTVIIVGAGAVGIELAGEILTKYPDKQVTFVDMAPTILPGFAPKCAEFALDWLNKRNVVLRLGEAIQDIGTESITLKTGEVLKAGVVYKCVGVMPNTSFLKESPPFLSNFGFRDSVNVNDQLQLSGHENIYCVGDMMSHASRELKLGHTAEVNGHLVAHNIAAALEGKPLAVYPEGVVGAKTTPKIFCLSLGAYDATLGFNWLIVNGWVAAIMKWLLEWTKVAAAAERPIGVLFWQFADWNSMLLGRTLLK